MDTSVLKARLYKEERKMRRIYRDNVGKLSFGVGHNGEDKDLSDRAIDIILDDDVADALRDLDRNMPWWRNLREGAQQALADMSFNMGWTRLAGFVKFIDALRVENYDAAADEMVDSHWYAQVGERAEELVAMVRGKA